MPILDAATKAKLAPVPKVKAAGYASIIAVVLVAALAYSKNLPTSQYQTAAVGILGLLVPLVVAYAKKDTTTP